MFVCLLLLGEAFVPIALLVKFRQSFVVYMISLKQVNRKCTERACSVPQGMGVLELALLIGFGVHTSNNAMGRLVCFIKRLQIQQRAVA